MEIAINGKNIGDSYPCFIIAEAGSNHNGSLDQAYKLIDAAAGAGADAVKFQTFQADKIYSKQSKPVEYLKKLGVCKNIYEIIKEMEMPREWLPKLADYCREKSIIFLTTPFDEESVDLCDEFLPAYKIASYELTHLPLLRHIARKNKPIIISTGASNMEEIEEAIKTIKSENNERICLMQCTAKYPAPLNSVNIKTIKTLKEKFGVPVGLSDHSRDPIIAPVAAVSIGANLLEKHFTLSNLLPGPDHPFAVEPRELAEMIKCVRKTEEVLGSGIKELQTEEKELVNYRRVIFANKEIKAGELFVADNLVILRKSGDLEEGIHSRELENIIGKTAAEDIYGGAMLLIKHIIK